MAAPEDTLSLALRWGSAIGLALGLSVLLISRGC